MLVEISELKRIREERSVTLRMISEQGVPYIVIWNAEYRGAPVPSETARIVAEVLGVEVEHLTGEKPAPPPPPDCPSWLALPVPFPEEVAV